MGKQFHELKRFREVCQKASNRYLRLMLDTAEAYMVWGTDMSEHRFSAAQVRTVQRVIVALTYLRTNKMLLNANYGAVHRNSYRGVMDELSADIEQVSLFIDAETLTLPPELQEPMAAMIENRSLFNVALTYNLILMYCLQLCKADTVPRKDELDAMTNCTTQVKAVLQGGDTCSYLRVLYGSMQEILPTFADGGLPNTFHEVYERCQRSSVWSCYYNFVSYRSYMWCKHPETFTKFENIGTDRQFWDTYNRSNKYQHFLLTFGSEGLPLTCYL